MKALRFFAYITKITLKKLCLGILPMAVPLLLCCFLPSVIGDGAKDLFSSDEALSYLKIAVTAEGDGASTFFAYMNNMADISEYGSFVVMDEDEALSALKRGEISAVLSIPDTFVDGVINGTNPDVVLTVDEKRPLEAALILYAGESAFDMLATAQAGIYSVIDIFEDSGIEIEHRKVVLDSNMRYIGWVLGRNGLFNREKVSVSGSIPISLNYALLIFSSVMLAFSAVFYKYYKVLWLSYSMRSLSVGRGSGYYFFATFISSFLVTLAPFFVFFAAMGEITASSLLASLLSAFFISALASLVIMVSQSESFCGAAFTVISLISLVISGGVIPLALMPVALASIGVISPIYHISKVLGAALGYGDEESAYLLLAFAFIFLISAYLIFDRESRKGERE